MRDFGAGESYGTPYGPPYGPYDRGGNQVWGRPHEEPPAPRPDLAGYGPAPHLAGYGPAPDLARYGGPGGLLDASWDPAEELASLLQDAIAVERDTSPPPPPQEPDHPLDRDLPDRDPLGTPPPDRDRPGHPPLDPGLLDPGLLDPDPLGRAPLAGLARITADLPPIRRSAAPGHRKDRARTIGWVPTVSYSIAALATVLVSMVSVFGGVIAYDPLRHIAEARTSADAVKWWPLLVYGPWLVASLSILRAAVHQRRAAHSWIVVLLFSLTAMLLCVAEAPRTFTDTAAAALPTVASLACFHQLVRLITLTRPPRRRTRRRRLARPAAGRTAAHPLGTHLPRQAHGGKRVL
ncbi:DUF2637 domain-containing protein [Streptomyces rubrolavendulae]|uniref:DUF2637 domain-containing protein n=1 Tax=Streptomyces rubrolavendulae TaxID=285473 RepID=A0A1D8GAA5_9ACTN|nr:DUF2637 domain-containing protein [Streptomyces rubrolavendulae]AOT62364.1 hypothetical protein A4G23_05260 [Streptomyces rubrolavendulae]